MQLPEFAGMHWDAETLVAPLSPTLEVVEGLRRKALAVRKRGTAIVTVTACALAAYLHIRYVVIPNHSDIDFLSIFPSILALTVFYGVADHFFGSPLRRYKREFKHTARELLLAEGP
jgi:hypothetical protein